MKITFVGIGSEQLAISLLSTVLRDEGHETALAFHPALFDYDGFFNIGPLARLLSRTEHVVDKVVAQEPDLVAFSVLTPAYQWSLHVAREIKRRWDVPVIFGGVHPSAVPDICLEEDSVDFVCVGEGETAIVRLCQELATGRHRPKEPIPNLIWRDGDRFVRGDPAPFLPDLDALPYYEKDIWNGEIRIQDTWMTMSSRGCPYRCTFCFNNFFANLPGKSSGRYLRQRSIDHMLGELVAAKAKWGIRRVDFEDDIFSVHKGWLHDFLIEYRREIDLPFQCLVHPRFVDDDIARWLKDAGCQHVQMGIQSVDDEYKRTHLRRAENDEHLRAALTALHSADLDLKADHIFGLPNEPERAQELARALYSEFPPRRIQTFWLVHLPGVEITTDAVRDGVLSPEEFDRINHGAGGRYHNERGLEEGPRFRRYELLFRLLPLLPRRLQQRIRTAHLPLLPEHVNHAVGMFLEVINAVINRDAETANFIRFHAHQIRRVLPSSVIGSLRRARHGKNSTRPVLVAEFADRVGQVTTGAGATEPRTCGSDVSPPGSASPRPIAVSITTTAHSGPST